MTETVVHVTTDSEVWKDVVGYEGLYQISTFGRVKSLKRFDTRGNLLKSRILKNVSRGNGYLSVDLCKNATAKLFDLHRLVAQAYIPNPDSKPQVNHIDEDKTNNNVDNLEWVTIKENANHGTRNRRIGKNIKVIYQDDTYEFWESAHLFAKNFGISNSGITECLSGRNKTCYGMRFEYA